MEIIIFGEVNFFVLMLLNKLIFLIRLKKDKSFNIKEVLIY